MPDKSPEIVLIEDPDSVRTYIHRWRPEGAPRASVHVAHGMGEHARRYDRLALALTTRGYTVYADDHRASGLTGINGGGLGNLGPRGMEGAIDSLHAVSHYAAAEEGVPIFLIGHSWGSFLAQRLIDRWGDEFAGAVLSASTLLTPDYLSLDDPNAHFSPAATPYDWLSRDPGEVQRYMQDPWCGIEVAFGLEKLLDLAGPPASTVPTGLPILVINGSDDPVGGFNRGGEALAAAYRDLGVGDVTFKEYRGGRHELLNETNRDEVIGDIITWLNNHGPGGSG
jgi:alpha-beta hydrolase superfamily lysophospholipase